MRAPLKATDGRAFLSDGNDGLYLIDGCRCLTTIKSSFRGVAL